MDIQKTSIEDAKRLHDDLTTSRLPHVPRMLNHPDEVSVLMRVQATMRPDASRIEGRFRESIDRFVALGMRPGGFITAVMCNDLREAIGRGDEGALLNLPHIVAYLVNNVPSGVWGSPERMQEWARMAWTREGRAS